MAENQSFQNWYNIEGFSETIASLGEEIIVNSTEKTYSSTVISNDSEDANISCYVNTNEFPFILKSGESFEFEFTLTYLKLVNLSDSNTASYRTFFQRRTKKYED